MEFHPPVSIITLGQFIILNHNVPITVDVPHAQENFSGDVVVYPNPSSQNGSIIIRTTLNEEMQIFIYDAMGKEVMKKNFSGTLEISSRNFSPGIYSWSARNKRHIRSGLFAVE